MARTDLETLVVQLDARFSKFEKSFDKAAGITDRKARQIEGRFKKMNANISNSFSGLQNLGRGLGAAFAAVGVQQFASAVQKAVKSIADIGDQATKLGLSNQAYQELAFAAQLAGVETASLASGMKRLAINSSDAANGSGDLGALFKANGISIRDANGQLLSQVEILARVADLVKNAPNEQDQLAIAQAALGKSGNELMGLLETGANGVREAMASAARDGIAFTDEQIAKAQELDDQYDVLIQTISVGLKGAALATGAAFVPFWETTKREIATITSLYLQMVETISSLSPDIGVDKIRAAREGILTQGTRYGGQSPVSTIPLTPANVDGKGSLPPSVGVTGAKAATTLLPPSKSTGSTSKAAKKAIDDVISSLNFEAAQLGRTARQQAIYNELQRAGVDATSEAGKTIAAKAGANYDEAESVAFLADIENRRFQMLEENVATFQQRQAEMRDSFMALGEIGVSALEGLIDGTKSFGETLQDLIGQLASAGLQAALLGQGPLAGLIGTSSGGGLLGSLASSLFGGGSVSAGIYHGGGIAGTGSLSRNISASAFANAPRYHNGGIAGLRPDEVPAILQRGEVVSPRGSKGSGGGTFNIRVDVTGARGDRDIMAMVQAGVSAGISKSVEGEASRSLERNLRG